MAGPIFTGPFSTGGFVGAAIGVIVAWALAGFPSEQICDFQVMVCGDTYVTGAVLGFAIGGATAPWVLAKWKE